MSRCASASARGDGPASSAARAARASCAAKRAERSCRFASATAARMSVIARRAAVYAGASAATADACCRAASVTAADASRTPCAACLTPSCAAWMALAAARCWPAPVIAALAALLCPSICSLSASPRPIVASFSTPKPCAAATIPAPTPAASPTSGPSADTTAISGPIRAMRLTARNPTAMPSRPNEPGIPDRALASTPRPPPAPLAADLMATETPSRFAPAFLASSAACFAVRADEPTAANDALPSRANRLTLAAAFLASPSTSRSARAASWLSTWIVAVPFVWP